MPELDIDNLSLAYGDVQLLDGVSLRIDAGERVGLLGRNGCGKSTLMKVIAGEVPPDSGEVGRRRGLVVARLAQEVPEELRGPVGDILRTPLDGSDAEAAADWQTSAQIERVASRLALDPAARMEDLSAGTKRRVLLARALAQEPDVLLLDEPTNHLDIETVAAVEDLLLRRQGALVFVTHDRAFLRRLATRILDLDRGVLRSYACDYETYLERKASDLEAEAEANAQFDKKLAQEEAWIRRGIKARRTRNEGRVRALQEMRRQRADRREVVGTVKARLTDADRSGRVVLRASDVAHSFGDHLVIEGFSTEIQRGDRVGILGPNGSGKTTLLRILLRDLAPTEGNVHHGVNLEVAHFDQLHSVLDETKTVQENVLPHGETLTVGGASRHIMGYLQDFLFTPDQIRGPIRELSGGERNRLQLARILARPCNLLVLDEPTNDLDLETLELLESLLVDYSGTLLLVSHDRDFIDNVVTSTIVFEGEARVHEYFGGYQDWLTQTQGKESSSDAATKSETKAKASAKAKSKGKPKTATPRRLSFKEKQELEALPRQLEELEAEKEELSTAMSSPDFFKQDGDTIARETTRLKDLEEKVAAAYERWETLEAIASGEVEG